MRKILFLFGIALCIVACTDHIDETDFTSDELVEEEIPDQVDSFVVHEVLDWELGDSLHSRALFCKNKNEVFVGSYAGRLLKLEIKDTSIQTINLNTPENLEDIRGVQLVDNELYAINSGDKGILFKVDINKNISYPVLSYPKNQFLNGLLFWDSLQGIVFGDPFENGELCVAGNTKYGSRWGTKRGIKTLPNEAGFSASNTAMCIRPEGKVWIGTGGDSIARVHYSANYGQDWKTFNTPLIADSSSGIFSMHFYDDLSGIAVGGSWLNPDNRNRISAITKDGGKSWETTTGLRGYRSCVASNGKITIACGRNGADFSLDNGQTWFPLFDEAFYTVVVKENYAWFSGSNGRFRRILF